METSRNKDDISAENALLKLKLELEHGMKHYESSRLSAEIENAWLNSVYKYETQMRNAKSIKMYERIGCPSFKKLDDLAPTEVPGELQRIRSQMAKNGVELDCICHYDDAVIYKFITEELFREDMDDISVSGMVYHYIYEEFHPNHDYDLRRLTTQFIDAILKRKWNAEHDPIGLTKRVTFAGKEYAPADISSIILAFQEAHVSLRLRKLDITGVTIDPECEQARVEAQLSYKAVESPTVRRVHEGPCVLSYVKDTEWWEVREFSVPGLSG